MLNQKTHSAKGSRVRALILLSVILVLFSVGLVYADTDNADTLWVVFSDHRLRAHFTATCLFSSGTVTAKLDCRNNAGSVIDVPSSDSDKTPYGWVIFYNRSGSMTQYVKYELPSWGVPSPYAAHTSRVLCRGALYDHAIHRNITQTVRAEAFR